MFNWFNVPTLYWKIDKKYGATATLSTQSDGSPTDSIIYINCERAGRFSNSAYDHIIHGFGEDYGSL